MERGMRPDKNTYYLDLAAQVAKRSTCLRRQYGVVIVRDDEIISTGYNGSARDEPNCCDTGTCWREAHKVPRGERYELCQSIHAEANAIISAARRDMIGATLYLAGWEDGHRIPAEPCLMCQRMIKQAGIERVVRE